MPTAPRSTAEAPGSGTTEKPASRAAETRSGPGSLTPGVPASVTNATSRPVCQHPEQGLGTAPAPSAHGSSRAAGGLRGGPAVPGCAGYLRLRRRATCRKQSAARGLKSARFPSGVATTYRVAMRLT